MDDLYMNQQVLGSLYPKSKFHPLPSNFCLGLKHSLLAFGLGSQCSISSFSSGLHIKLKIYESKDL